MRSERCLLLLALAGCSYQAPLLDQNLEALDMRRAGLLAQRQAVLDILRDDGKQHVQSSRPSPPTVSERGM